MLVFGSSIGEGNYTRPVGEVVTVDYYNVGIPLLTNETLAAADDAKLNLEVASEGKIPKGCKAITIWGRCENSSVADDAGLVIGNEAQSLDFGASVNIFPMINSYNTYGNGVVLCDSAGDIYIKNTAAGDTISNVYIRATQVHLR
jgi:hypothetical protein